MDEVKKNVQTTEWVKSNEEVQLEKLLFEDATEKFTQRKVCENSSRKKATLRTAWTDEDDNISVGQVKRKKNAASLSHLNKSDTYKEYLLDRFEKFTSTPKWADFVCETKRNEDNEEYELLASVGFLKNSSSSISTLKPSNLSFKKLKDLNRDTYAEELVSSIQFHPSSTVALVSGWNGIASIYAIDGAKNEKLHSIKFNNFPIKCAKLYEQGSKALFGGIKNYLFSYDLMQTEEKCYRFPKSITRFSKFDISPCEKFLGVVGKFGEIHLLDLRSKELIHTFKQEEVGSDIKFSKDSTKIFTNSCRANVSVLNIKTNRLEHTFIDEGCIQGSSLDIDPSGNLIATGSKEGVVNLYKYVDVLTSKYPKPLKTLYNLTTAISDVKFNSSSEILGFCSDMVPGAVRLLHCASGTVFSNFPGFQDKINKTKLLAFSPSSGYLALGSTSKEAPLYRLKHFNNY